MWRGWFFSIVALAVACGGRLADDSLGGDDAIIPYDGGAFDATTVDASPPLGDYSDITDPNAWSSFDVTSVDPNANGFYGVTFDGRYMYMAPEDGDTDLPHGQAVRFDTQGSFTSSSAWTTFDLTSVSASARGFGGAAFDGRYVYFVPHGGEVNWNNEYYAFQAASLLARFDTHASFTDASAWSIFDLSTLNDQAQGFCGGTFDGRYLYLIPFGPDGDQPPPQPLTESVAVRFDTQGDFSSSSSYSTMDLTHLPNEPSRRCGGIFDGRYLYLIESQNGPDVTGAITRYDTTSIFTDTSSWSIFDVANVDDHARGFAGAAFDGRSLYVMSYWYGDVVTSRYWDGVTARFDTEQSFNDASSWQSWDTSSFTPDASGYHMGGFDGRFVYFVPLQAQQNDAVIARYDTMQPHKSRNAWSFSPHYSQLGVTGQGGGVLFDGQSLYFVPTSLGHVLRFNARKGKASMPSLPQFTGSFF